MIKQIQTLLKEYGHYNGKIDGVAGNGTLNGIKELIALAYPTSTNTAASKIPNISNSQNLVNELQFSHNGMRLVAKFEGYVSKPYKDAVGIWTIGYGNTYYPDGRKVGPKDRPLSKKEAEDLKIEIVNRDFAPAIREMTKGLNITQNQFDALISLGYNIGVNALAKSSVIKYLKAGDIQRAADSFLLWNKAGGKVLNGLVNRRKAERELFLK